MSAAGGTPRRALAALLCALAAWLWALNASHFLGAVEAAHSRDLGAPVLMAGGSMTAAVWFAAAVALLILDGGDGGGR